MLQIRGNIVCALKLKKGKKYFFCALPPHTHTQTKRRYDYHVSYYLLRIALCEYLSFSVAKMLTKFSAIFTKKFLEKNIFNSFMFTLFD